MTFAPVAYRPAYRRDQTLSDGAIRLPSDVGRRAIEAAGVGRFPSDVGRRTARGCGSADRADRASRSARSPARSGVGGTARTGRVSWDRRRPPVTEDRKGSVSEQLGTRFRRQ